MIFARVFRSEGHATIEERMENIRKHFETSDYIPYLCLFNAVFDVYFPKTPEYEDLSSSNKYKGLQKLFINFSKMVSDRYFSSKYCKMMIFLGFPNTISNSN